jgi:dephospho-CoA kinase
MLNVFLLGRPGSGKSLVFRLLAEEIRLAGFEGEIVKVDDFPLLMKIFEEDREMRRRRPVPGGFKITDESVWHELNRELARKVAELQSPGRIVFVEFSRRSYAEALGAFGSGILGRSLAVYVDTPFDACLQRNLERKGADADSHLVPEEEMRKTYAEDDRERISEFLPLIVIDNSRDIESLRQKVRPLARTILEIWKEHA